jgi:hypothetical protein
MLVRMVFAAFLVLTCLAACSKVPESEQAKKIGNIPKQTIDKAQDDVSKALQQGAERTRDADQKQ